MQDALIKDGKERQAAEKQGFHFDELQMYFGEDFTSPSGVIISQPKIGDVIHFGEKKFYNALSPFLCNSTSIRLQLWKANIDWTKLRDIEVFSMLITGAEKEPLKKMFPNVNIEDFKLISADSEIEGKGKDLFLYNTSQNILISENEFTMITEYLRTVLNVHPKVEKAKGRTAKEWMIQEEELKLYEKSDDKKSESTLLPLVSACINHPGFKYKLEELKDMGMYQFMDSVRRIQKYEAAIAALRGSYSGFVDTSKMDKEVFNFMGEV